MSIDTAKVTDRRTLRFASFDDIIADAEVLHAHGYERRGNWTLGQVCDHLARLMHGSIDGIEVRVPLHQRVGARLLRPWLLRRGFPAGIPFGEDAADQLKPDDAITDADGLEALHRAVNRLRIEPPRHPSPVLGHLSPDQWEQLHCRHAELHLSFLVPKRA